MISAVIFDLEGIIIDSERQVWIKSAHEFLNRRGLLYEKEKLKHLTMGRTMSDGMKIWQDYYGFEGNIEDLCKERREIVRQLFNRPIDFIPGFNEFFVFVDKKYKVAVATSLEKEFLGMVDKTLHITQLFHNHVYSSDELHLGYKPSPDIYLYAAEHLRIKPSACAVLEDSPNGIKAAKQAGMKCIALATTSVAKDRLIEADMIVDSYSEINLNNFS